ncbi:MAG: 16S rRNA (cytidine(1402)-2'-O)-methyltransferase [Leptolyngbyaceae cyanobacterium CRU_2_3]|nr:16S rRNA (cytidine(1402)-2'-O)-methyltransferase [Leptolyngbyaceae cyanobacterium CRU_2_3]
MDIQAGTLYIVGTPIGNLEDITFRALEVLRKVDVIAAEDTRHTGRLLQHFQITTPQISYHDHNRHTRHPEILQRLQQGEALALVSDAGMPGISDPGSELVKFCIEANILVVPIPGVTAVITALSAGGLPSDRFVFEGFLPAKGQERHDRLEAIGKETRTLVIYESPHRLQQTLKDLLEPVGAKCLITIARELTKLHEQFWRGSLTEAIAYYQDRDPQGEYTLILAGCETAHPLLTEAALLNELQQLMQQGLSRSQASRQIAQQTTLSRRQVYQLALTISSDVSTEARNPEP